MTADEGLRARKQRQTREAIHRTAVRHALSSDPDTVTVADISADANVSTRTFFNYFPSKEDAMLGFHEALPTDEELAEFANSPSSDLLRDVVYLMRNVFSAGASDHDIRHDRRELLRRHPQLLQRQMTRLFAVEQRIATVVAERMRRLDAYNDVTDIDAASRVLVMLATGAIRNAVRNAAQPAHPPPTSAGEDAAFEASLTILREVAARIQ